MYLEDLLTGGLIYPASFEKLFGKSSSPHAMYDASIYPHSAQIMEWSSTNENEGINFFRNLLGDFNSIFFATLEDTKQ